MIRIPGSIRDNGVPSVDRTAVKKEFSILVVDDNRVNVRILEQALRKTGYHVLTAADGAGARDLAQVRRI